MNGFAWRTAGAKIIHTHRVTAGAPADPAFQGERPDKKARRLVPHAPKTPQPPRQIRLSRGKPYRAFYPSRLEEVNNIEDSTRHLASPHLPLSPPGRYTKIQHAVAATMEPPSLPVRFASTSLRSPLRCGIQCHCPRRPFPPPMSQGGGTFGERADTKPLLPPTAGGSGLHVRGTEQVHDMGNGGGWGWGGVYSVCAWP